jgi:hypothetical protein
MYKGFVYEYFLFNTVFHFEHYISQNYELHLYVSGQLIVLNISTTEISQQILDDKVAVQQPAQQINF